MWCLLEKTSLGKFLIFGKHITQDKNTLKKYTNRNFIIFVKKQVLALCCGIQIIPFDYVFQFDSDRIELRLHSFEFAFGLRGKVLHV